MQLVLSSIIMLEVRISRVGDNFSEHERIFYFCFTAHIGTVNTTVPTAGTFNNLGSQIGVQVGRKKRAAQFNNLGSQIGQQIDQSQNFNFGPMPGMGQWGGYRFGGGFGRSQFNNYGSQIGQQFGRKKRSPKLQSSIYY